MTATFGGPAVQAPDALCAPSPVAVGFAADLGRHRGRTALAGDGRTLTYADLAHRVASAAADLDALAPGTQHLVALRPKPTADFVVAYLAALAGGHTVLLSREETLGRAYAASATYAAGFRATGRAAPVLHPDLRLLLSTSGSTGSPKLVRLSATNLDSNARAIAAYLHLTHDDTALTTLPLDYCYGLSVLHSHLTVGATVVLSDLSVSDPVLWDLARDHGVTTFAGVPYTFDLLAAAGWPDLPSLRLVTQAGGRMAPERVRALAEQGQREGFDLFVMYGQTEATARMAYLPPHLAAEHPGAIGVPIPGGALRIDPVDGLDASEALGPGVGELVYSGPNVMMGYAHAVPDLALGQDLTELRTGDLARTGAGGLIEIVGRRSRFAKVFGQRIDLDRVEALLALDHHEVACAESRERLVVAAVTPAPVPAVTDAVVAATGLPAHAVSVVTVEEVPRRANGKVDQAAVAALASPVPEPRAAPTTDPEADLVALYGDVIGSDGVTPDSTFVSLGGDSLSYVELAVRLEQRLLRVPDDWPTRTIHSLARLATDRPRGRWARLETGILLRAVAIVLIVGSHTNLWSLLGGAHVLLAAAGANFARFHLADEGVADRVRRVARSASRIAVPAVLWIGVVALLTGEPGWRTVLLLNDVLGGKDWSEPAWHYWFVEVVLLLALGSGLLTAVPRVMALERRHRFGFALGLTALALVPRHWATATSYDGDVIHSSTFVAWLFLGGWAAAVARGTRDRLLVTAVLVSGTWGFTGSTERELLIAAGLLALVWVRSVPWPRLLVAPTGTIASASLFVYLTHWQVYPAFEHRWPLGGLLASLAVGVLAATLVNRLPSWMWRNERPRSHHAPAHHHRQETR